jgi:hypothetical protein
MFRYKDMTPPILGQFCKKRFFTQLAVVHSDLRRLSGEESSSLVWLVVGGWREDQHMWDSQGLKDPCFFKTFCKITKSQRKAYFMRQKSGSLTLKTFQSIKPLKKARPIPFRPWPF